MKILILSPLYLPERYGGIEKVVHEFTRRLDSKNIEVVVVCGTHTTERHTHKAKTKIHRIHSEGAFNEGSFQKYYEVNNQALEILKQEKPDIIWVHDWFFALAALNYSETHTVRILGQAHILKRVESRARVSPWRSFIDLMQNLLFRSSETVLAVSETQVRSLHQHYRIPKNRIQLLHYGLDETRPQTPIRSANQRPTFLYLGRFETEKNIENLFDSLLMHEQLITQTISLKMMGTGSRQKILEEKASHFKNVAVDFIPFSSCFKDIQNVILNSDVLVLPSVYDSYGLAALEALSLEVPVIVSRQCGISEDLHFYPKPMIFDANDKISMGEAILYCLQNLEHLPAIGQSARNILQSTHRWDRSLDLVLDRIRFASSRSLYV